MNGADLCSGDTSFKNSVLKLFWIRSAVNVTTSTRSEKEKETGKNTGAKVPEEATHAITCKHTSVNY